MGTAMTQNDQDTAARNLSLSTVLVVEDEVLIRLSIADYLRECGYRVIETASAEEAITVLVESGRPVDVIFSDAEMPGAMDGFGLSKWARANRPGLPVILVGSPSGAANAAAELCEEGPQLSKPYEPQQLLDQIRRLLGLNTAGQSSGAIPSTPPQAAGPVIH